MTGQRFICAWCGQGFIQANADAEIAAAYEARFDHEYQSKETVHVCGDCDAAIARLLRDNPAVLAEIEAKYGPIDLDAKPARVM